MPDPGSRADWLAAVAAALRLDPETEDDVLDELQSHLDDSIEALERSGRTPRDAEREALRRLGDPATLGRNIRKAQQSRKRLLAAVGGSVLGAADGAVRGLVPAFGAYIVATFVSMIGVAVVSSVTGTYPSDLETAGLIVGAVLGVALAYGAARAATRALARTARRPLAQTAATVAVAGGLTLTLFFFFALRIHVTAIALALEAAMVASWIMGAVAATDRITIELTRRTQMVVAGLIGVLSFVAMLGTLAPTMSGADDPFPPDPDLSLLGARFPSDQGPTGGFDSGRGLATATFQPPEDPDTFEPVDAFPSSWSAPQLELWPALHVATTSPFPGDDIGAPDPAFGGPIRVVAMEAGADIWSGAIRIDDIRGIDQAWVVATMLVDGERVVVRSWSTPVTFEGTPWEWLQTPATPTVVDTVR